MDKGSAHSKHKKASSLRNSEKKFLDRLFILLNIHFVLFILDLFLVNSFRYFLLLFEVSIALYCWSLLFNRIPQVRIVLVLLLYSIFLFYRGLQKDNWQSYFLFDVWNFSLLSFLLVLQSGEGREYFLRKFPNVVAK